MSEEGEGGKSRWGIGMVEGGTEGGFGTYVGWVTVVPGWDVVHVFCTGVAVHA